ncbi:hypothetical protein NS365_07610 [Aureimonas ureilytica]|uniref:Uncharacterized protein n=1 Tax=Aureimonas ureilytica TaxID=401562 RepID=A0A175RS96_9HYPH|nr:hypothetical protein [Aureimonas ureilytica]KTR06283.1 hypothetical protein NS365_07610 [Aureimonas ureilytica]
MDELSYPAAKARMPKMHNVPATPECSGLRIPEEQSANGTLGQAADVIRVRLGGGPRPKDVLAENDGMPLRAVEAIKTTGASGLAWQRLRRYRLRCP